MPEAKEIVLDRSDSFVQLDDALVPFEARRIKYEYLVGKVIARGEKLDIPARILYYNPDVRDTISYKVVETEPDGEVEVTTNTIVRIADIR